MAGKRKRRRHLIQTLTLTKGCSPESTRSSSCSAKHTHAGDVHVSKAAGTPMKLRGTCPSLLPTRVHILHCFLALLDDLFCQDENQATDAIFVSFSSPLAFETLA